MAFSNRFIYHGSAVGSEILRILAGCGSRLKIDHDTAAFIAACNGLLKLDLGVTDVLSGDMAKTWEVIMHIHSRPITLSPNGAGRVSKKILSSSFSIM
jgi:hypothetical protein